MQGQLQHQAQVSKELRERLEGVCNAVALQSSELDAHKTYMGTLETRFQDGFDRLKRDQDAALSRLSSQVGSASPDSHLRCDLPAVGMRPCVTPGPYNCLVYLRE